MRIASAAFFALALGLALVFGAQTEAWSWGPALLALGLAVACGIPLRSGGSGAVMYWMPLLLAAGWIALRCVQSPVLDFARSDGMLVLALVATAWVTSKLSGGAALHVVLVGVALAVLANLAIAGVQHFVPGFTWPYAGRPDSRLTGLFGHANYFSNFVGGGGSLLLTMALLSRAPLGLRVFYGAVFLPVLPIVWLSGSRGGLVALGAALCVLVVACGLVGWRRKSRWFPALAAIAPVILVAGCFAGVVMLKGLQERRHAGHRAIDLADNSARLEWMELALRVSDDHPLAGGGSRAYSWERNKHWDVESFGAGEENERFVHNELLQVVTDYGWIGAALVIAALGAVAWRQFVGLVLGSKRAEDDGEADPLRVGVLVAGAAMLVQANVSFVFHMLPNVMLFGLLLGLALGGVGRLATSDRRGLPGVAGALLLLPLLGFGWASTQALRWLWPVLYSSPPLWINAPELAVGRLDRAAQWWPGFRVHEQRARVARLLAARKDLDEADILRWNRMAEDAYRQAVASHPFHPGLAVNLANTCSALGESEEAERWFVRAAELEGGLEVGFRARFYHAKHVADRSFELWQQRQSAKALAGFKRATGILDEADALTPSYLRGEHSEPLREWLVGRIAFLEGAGIQPSE